MFVRPSNVSFSEALCIKVVPTRTSVTTSPVYTMGSAARFQSRTSAVDSDDAAIIVAIIGMARALHLTVVAEGVETAQQMSFLRNHGCNEIQGFLFSQPLSADDMTELLKAQAGQHSVIMANSTV